jgi:hypothetical protein
MKRTITAHLEVADEAEYAEAIMYMTRSPWSTGFVWSRGSQSLNELLEAEPDPIECTQAPQGGTASAFPRGGWARPRQQPAQDSALGTNCA